MREKTKLKLILLVVLLAAIVLLPVGNVKASLQANPNTNYKTGDWPGNWMINIRCMEKPGEAMGLNETVNSDLTASSDSNGIDVHMMKSTEYGAIAILSASGYGNPQTLQNSTEKTTTGNKTGVYFSGANKEWIAGGMKRIYSNINSKYYDEYIDSDTSAKVGDALGGTNATNPGCVGWHGSSGAEWVSVSYPRFCRGFSGLFSYGNSYGDSSGTGGPAWARGVAICGQGL